MDSSCMVIKFYQFTKQHITPLTLSLTTLGNTNLFCQSNQSIKGQNTLFSLSRLLMNLWVCSLSLLAIYIQFSSVAQSCLTLLWPHGRQHARPPCPSSTPRAFPNSCPLSRWCHPTISSSVIPFSSHPQSFPASGSSPMSQFFALDGQSTGLSALASVLPMNIQDWYPLDWLVGSPCSPMDSQESSPIPSSKPSILQCSAFFIVQLSHIHTCPLEKP